ncbi:MAG: UPF0175 family protein [Acidobacteriota bacterium]
MSVTISDEILESVGMSDDEFQQEIAVYLYQQNKLTIGQAGKLAKLNQFQFQKLLASREISIHYEVRDFEKDLETLKEIKSLGLL